MYNKLNARSSLRNEGAFMANLYISYRVKDRTTAIDIAARLRALGHHVAIDTDVLVGGQAWRSVLQAALSETDCVIAVIGREWLAGQYALTELGAARALGKPIIPVILGDVPIPDVVNDLYCLRYLEHNVDEVMQEIEKAIRKLANRNVFIVHGHDEAKKYELKSFLRDLGLNAIILHEQDSLGKTIIEKFEHYAAQSNFAFILMTPDDNTVASDSTEGKWRARQNVIMELGWFMAKLGRSRVVLLQKGELELPTDILGIVYYRFNESVLEVSESIRQSLKGAGLLT
jgi:predicted nucleotide-binding protein